MWEGIFTTLGLDFEVIPRPETWLLRRATAAQAKRSSRAEAVLDPAHSRGGGSGGVLMSGLLNTLDIGARG